MAYEELAYIMLSYLGQKNVDEAVVIINEKTTRQIRFSNNVIMLHAIYNEVTVDVMFIKDNRMMVSSFNVADPKIVKKGIDNLIYLHAKVKPLEKYRPLPDKIGKYPEVSGGFDKSIVEVDPERLVDYIDVCIGSALEHGARRVAGTLYCSYWKKHLTATNGVSVNDCGTHINLDVRAFVKKRQTGHYFTCARRLSDFRPGKAGREAGIISSMSDEVIKGKPGKYRVLLGKSAIGSLMNMFAYAISAFSVLSGQSFLKEKIGETVGPEILNVSDKPLSEGYLGARKFDDDGIPVSNHVLIENGMLKTYVHNRVTAAQFDTETTAHAGWITPMPWHLEISSGEHSDEELLEEVRDGLFVNNVTYIRFHNYIKGDFSAIVRDGVYAIEDGEIVGRVKGLRMDSNLLEILKNVRAIGKDSEQIFHWWMEFNVPVTAPKIVVDDVGFSVATM
ncbi:MAG TPA: TldD/PmbA family protein [Candidatus Bathyarchaeota archaeon]|nr:TldD/PmbA family protein [Candidatus Bathyarchaeota archaeon]